MLASLTGQDLDTDQATSFASPAMSRPSGVASRSSPHALLISYNIDWSNWTQKCEGGTSAARLVAAMDDELQALNQNGTWELVWSKSKCLVFGTKGWVCSCFHMVSRILVPMLHCLFVVLMVTLPMSLSKWTILSSRDLLLQLFKSSLL